MRSNAALRALTVLGLGAAGLIGGHALAYTIAVPDDAHRTTLLDATGHAYLPSASKLAIVLGIAAVVTGVVCGYVHRSHGRPVSSPATAWRISLLQCAGFVALEVIERAMVSASLTTLSVGVIVIGLFTQIVVAFLVALLVAGLRRLGAALRSRSARARVVAAVRRTVLVRDQVPSSRTPVHDHARGPPAALAI